MLIAMLFASVVITTPAAPADCEAVGQREGTAFDNAMRARDWDKAEPILVRLERACADHPLGGVLHNARAEMLIGRKDPAAALRLLDRPWPSRWAGSGKAEWLKLSAYEAIGDKPGFRAQRDRMVAANDAAMSGGRPAMKTRKRERFETPLAVVDAYEGTLNHPPFFVRRYVFVASPKDGGMPASVALTGHLQSMMTGNTEAYFIDLYPCRGHVTLESTEGVKGEWPAYDKVKASAIEAFSSPESFEPKPADMPSRTCGFTRYMLPGLE